MPVAANPFFYCRRSKGCSPCDIEQAKKLPMSDSHTRSFGEVVNDSVPVTFKRFKDFCQTVGSSYLYDCEVQRQLYRSDLTSQQTLHYCVNLGRHKLELVAELDLCFLGKCR